MVFMWKVYLFVVKLFVRFGISGNKCYYYWLYDNDKCIENECGIDEVLYNFVYMYK